MPAEVSDLRARSGRARRAVEPPRLLSLSIVAEQLSVSRRTVERMLRHGDLPFVDVAGRRLVRSDQLAQWIEQHTHYGKGEAR